MSSARADGRRRGPLDVLFVVVVSLLLGVHLTIFVTTMLLAPETAAEARTLRLLELPVEVARAIVLPFHALLLGSLFVLGRRAAGRWAGFGAMLAVLALDLRVDAADPVYGPGTAEGAWIAASLLAAALVLLPTRRLVSAALIGAASGCYALLLFALPAFLIALAIAPAPERRRRASSLLAFAGVWFVPAAVFQLIWLSRLGPDGWLARASEFAAEFRPHALVPFLEQQRLLFAGWHFDARLTVVLFAILVGVGAVGAVRYLLTPLPLEAAGGERVSRVITVLRRFPIEFWAIAITMLFFAVWWAFSGDTTLIVPNLPPLVVGAPLITAMAYRGAKWLLTVNAFWKVAAIVYLTGLMTARTIQLLITLVQAFQA